MLIKTNKGDFPVRYGWSALAKFGDLVDKNMDEVLAMDLDKMKISDMLMFILVGFQDGARREGVECAFKNVEEIGDLIDEDTSVIEKVIEAFTEMSKSSQKGDDKKK